MTARDYAFLADQYPDFRLQAHSDRELEDLLDAWFATGPDPSSSTLTASSTPSTWRSIRATSP